MYVKNIAPLQPTLPLTPPTTGTGRQQGALNGQVWNPDEKNDYAANVMSKFITSTSARKTQNYSGISLYS